MSSVDCKMCEDTGFVEDSDSVIWPCPYKCVFDDGHCKGCAGDYCTANKDCVAKSACL
jgi:hypothetical protein